MEMHQVRYFLAVARLLNFTKAAHECNVAQPSLTRGIKNLEHELGGDLFRRERSLTHLTELGRSVHPALRQCYDSAIAAKSLASAYHKDGHAPLNLALSRSIDMGLLTTQLREITNAFPKIQIKLFRGPGREIADKLRSGDVEVAIAGPFDDDWDRFETNKLFDERYGLLVSRHHALAGANRIEIEALREQRLICCTQCTMAGRLIASLEGPGKDEIARHQVPLPDDIVDLVRAEYGVGVHSFVRQVPSDLVLAEIGGIDLSRDIQVITVAGRRHSPATVALQRLLRAQDWSRAIASDGRLSAVVE